jgi:N-methylhydantoinase A/oxoprolinase/acetone carboxylase beta subunit
MYVASQGAVTADCAFMVAQQHRIALGVDTGGTYTDAVVYDEDARAILAKAKSPTTHDDLSIGISGAIDAALDSADIDPAAVRMVALSTTLATNALVEGTGRPACLVTIGFETDALDRGGLREAVGSDAVVAVDGGHTSHGEEAAPLDLDALADEIDAVADQADAFAVTAQFATRNAEHELAARDLIRERTGKPVTCSHQLSARLNGPKRGVTALLNSRLIALIDELVATTGSILEERGIDAPMMIVRGNGSLVSTDFVRERPVETILSGPAASLVGAAHLAEVDDAVISDIGGTTTDIAVVRGGLPEFSLDGASVGGHRTMVEAVMMHTHGLGGDSEVALIDRAVGAQLQIGPRRVVPLSLLADRAGAIVHSVLQRQLDNDLPGVWDGVFLEPTARIHNAKLDRFEQEIVDALGDELLPADRVVRSSLQERAIRRLVGRAVIRMSAFTPTDASHVLRRQATNDVEAARLGAELFARRRDRFGRAIAEDTRTATAAEIISTVVVDTLVRRSAEALLDAALVRDGLPAEASTSALVAAAIDGTTRSARVVAGLGVPLIGLGAPAGTYYPAVGELLGCPVEVPEHAGVANAIGAVVGKVRVRAEIMVTCPRRGVYRIHSGTDPETAWERPQAQERAEALATEAVTQAAVEAGAVDFEIETTWTEKVVDVEGRPMFVEGTATAIASGRPNLD